MRTQSSYYCKMLILGVTVALAACLLALALSAPPAQAASQRGDLSITQSDDPDPLQSGYLIYTLTVEHELVEDGCEGHCYWSGPIRVEDALPPGVEAAEINVPTLTGDGHDVSVPCTGMGTSTVTCTVDDLHDSDSVDIEIVAKVTTAGAQTLTNTATVSSVDNYHPDPNAANNSSTATTQVAESYTPPSGCASVCPNTTLTEKPEAFSDSASPRFSFTSNDANAAFECKMDAGTYQSCASPKQYILLSEGQHTFQVRAKDASGNVDPIPAKYTWTLDSISPKVAFTEKPRNVTTDRSPTWAWTLQDANPRPGEESCDLDEDVDPYRQILYIDPCSSPYTLDADLPDGHYSFEIETYDEAGNYGYRYSEFEVDTVAPKIVSAKPTGRLVKPSADVVVILDDRLYKSNSFVNIYKKGSNTPLAVYRYTYEDPDSWENVGIELSPKSYLKRDTRYTVKVTTGVNDGVNNLETPYTWSFKTKP